MPPKHAQSSGWVIVDGVAFGPSRAPAAPVARRGSPRWGNHAPVKATLEADRAGARARRLREHVS